MPAVRLVVALLLSALVALPAPPGTMGRPVASAARPGADAWYAIEDLGEVGVWFPTVVAATGSVVIGNKGCSGDIGSEPSTCSGTEIGNAQRGFVVWRGTATEIGPPGWSSRTTALNAAGQVTGSIVANHAVSPLEHAFLYADGATIDLGVPGGLAGSSAGTGINGYGHVIGRWCEKDVCGSGRRSGFLYRDGMMTDLGDLTVPMAINDAGQIVGYRGTADFTFVPEHAVLIEDAGITDLHELLPVRDVRGARSQAIQVNSAGQVLGWSDTADGVRGFLYQNGAMADLGLFPPRRGFGNVPVDVQLTEAGHVFGNSVGQNGHATDSFFYTGGERTDTASVAGDGSRVVAVNAAGTVLGQFAGIPTPNGIEQPNRAFLFGDGALIDLGTLGGAATEAWSLNDAGQVIGRSQTAAGEWRVFFYEGGAMTDLARYFDPLGTSFPGPNRLAGETPLTGRWVLTADGAAVGLARLASGEWAVMRYGDGALTELARGVAGPARLPAALSDAGHVAGAIQLARDVRRAFLFRGGEFTMLEPPGGFEHSDAVAVNAAGQVAVTAKRLRGTESWSEPLGSERSFLYDGGSYVDLGSAGGGWNHATGLNRAGAVVGCSGRAAGGGVAYVYHSGRLTALAGGCAVAVNDTGMVAGSSGSRAFLYRDGRMTDLGLLPGGAAITPLGINGRGEVIGYATTSGGGFGGPNDRFSKPHAFLHRDGSLLDLGTLGGPISTAKAINSQGDVVGSSHTSPECCATRAFLYRDGRMTGLGALPGLSSSDAADINDLGEIVGFAQETGGPRVGDEYGRPLERRAFVYRDGAVADLNGLLPANSGWTLTEARRINAVGQILGYGIRDGVAHSFLLTLSAQ